MYGTAKSSGSISEGSGYGSSGGSGAMSSGLSSSSDPCNYEWGCIYVTLISGGDYEAEMPSVGFEPRTVIGVGEASVCNLYVSDDISLFIYDGVWHVQIGSDALSHEDGAIPDTSPPYGTWSDGFWTLTIEPCCSWVIENLIYLGNNGTYDAMRFDIRNTGNVAMEITNIVHLSDVDALFATGLPITLNPGDSVTIDCESVADLRGTTFEVTTDCGSQTAEFPVE